MRIGKLTSSELQKYVFDKTVAKNPEILQSAGLAEDCAALRTPKILLLTTDPITATGNNAGRLAITVSANDVAVSGGTPLCCLLTIIAPTTSSAEDVGKFMKEAHETAEALGVDIVGGHTEFSEAVNRMVVSCTMLGTTRRVVKSSGAKAGDSIVMTKSAAIEATAIMANDHADKLLKTDSRRKNLSKRANISQKCRWSRTRKSYGSRTSVVCTTLRKAAFSARLPNLRKRRGWAR